MYIDRDSAVPGKCTNSRIIEPNWCLGVPAGHIPLPVRNFRLLRRDVCGAEGDVAAAAGLETCQVRFK